MPSTTSTFHEYLNATKPNAADIVDALSFAATCHPIFKNNAVLQEIVNGKNKEITATDLTAIIKAAVAHAVSIAKPSINVALNQQLAVNTEVQIINGAVAYLNSILLQNIQNGVASLSEIDAVRRYSKGKA